MNRLIAKIIGQGVLANVVLMFVILGGVVGSMSLVREDIPEVSVDTILVEIAYPGADPHEVEEGISRKIEEAVDGLEGIKRYSTISVQNTSRSVVQIIEGYPMEKALDSVRNAIDSIATFPPDAEKPIISEITIRSEVIFVALSGAIGERVGKETAEKIKDEIQALPGISQVSISGAREYEIAIELSEGALRKYGLTFQDVTAALRQGSVNLSGGTLKTKGEKIEIKAVGRKYTGQEFAKIVVLARPSGEIITLDQVATIRDAFTEDEIVARFNGEPCVMIGVFKTKDEDTIAVARATRAYVEQKAPTLPDGIRLTAWNDTSVGVESRINLLLRNGAIGLAIVVCMLLVFMDVRLSFWVSMGIPISIAGAIVILAMLGGTLNVMTLLGLILVMGIIVDDAIVVGEAIFVKRSEGEEGVAAATHGVMEVGIPVVAAVTTTIVAFIPLFFIPSVVGKFVANVPVVVIAALTVSILESLFLLPAHLTHLPDPESKEKSIWPWVRLLSFVRGHVTRGLAFFINSIYSPFLKRALQLRYVVASVAVAFLLVTFGLVGGGVVEYVLFPDMDSPYINAGIEFPKGTPIEITEAAVKQTEDALRAVSKEIEATGEPPVVRNIYSLIGQGSDLFSGQAAGPHFGLVRVELYDSSERSFHARELIARWQKRTGSVPGAITQSFGTMDPGPPGAPILVWLKGDNVDSLTAAADELKAKLKTYAGTYQIEDDYREGNRELQIDLKPEARSLGITLEHLASQVYAGFYGEEAMRIQRGRDDIRVKVRYGEQERSTLAELERIHIRTPSGQEVPFFSVANVKFGRSIASITRAEGLRTVAVSAEIDEQVANAEKILADLEETYMPGLEGRYPDMAWSFEGAKQDSNEAVRAIIVGFILAMLTIYAIVATVFRSYVQPIIILITVPFGITGAIYGHLLMGIPLTLFSIFGMVALAGVVVNDAIVLIEAVNSRIATGLPFLDAVRLGGMRRFRAILLTTISTSGGLTPLIFETDFAAAFLIPMALSVAAGVLVATVFTLVLIPSLLVMLNDARRLAFLAFHGRWPSREEVEPARIRNVDLYEESIQPNDTSDPMIAK